jgi:hypothetical protein
VVWQRRTEYRKVRTVRSCDEETRGIWNLVESIVVRGWKYLLDFPISLEHTRPQIAPRLRKCETMEFPQFFLWSGPLHAPYANTQWSCMTSMWGGAWWYVLQTDLHMLSRERTSASRRDLRMLSCVCTNIHTHTLDTRTRGHVIFFAKFQEKQGNTSSSTVNLKS